MVAIYKTVAVVTAVYVEAKFCSLLTSTRSNAETLIGSI